MGFSKETIEAAWKRAGGKCECRRKTHSHPGWRGRCGKTLSKSNTKRVGRGAWEAHHISTTGGDGLRNCEILCIDCHKGTRSFGKPKKR